MSDLASFVPPPSSQAPRAFGLRMSMPASIAHNYTPLTPVAFLLRAALVCPNALAVIHAERAVQYTYAQWAARCLSLTFALLKTPGFTPGARVAVISPNNPMILEAHNAILAAGGIINPLK
jgi:acyl-CoA synthetase (AMP-forming)/AMP-acid ligase II